MCNSTIYPSLRGKIINQAYMREWLRNLARMASTTSLRRSELSKALWIMCQSFSIPQINRQRRFRLPRIAMHRSLLVAFSITNLHREVHRRLTTEQKMARISTRGPKYSETSRVVVRKSSICTSRARPRRRLGKIAALSLKRLPQHSFCRMLLRLKYHPPSTLQSHRQVQ